MGLNSLKSIYDTLNNTELSTFEKTTQIMMSLSMAIPALISGFKNFGNAIHFVFSA
jgi:Sec7-like guanine-nucleotide exchange factor